MPEKSKKFETFRVAIGLALVALVSNVVDYVLPESSFWVQVAVGLAVIVPLGLALDAVLTFGYKTWRRR
ncbi:hypothetical protein [Sinorhizobium sp. GL28]|uniref:hypothetical protein n=1 Tax=Sinorhizobium sp. GL28 TaxID=1358418 RepID=UPI00071E399E|nr:hypothetical protein [Sinorhizobium sp. GL28]KSV89760.1 hypothetical protein N184_27085 [Sinorhizobium sp. GL28]